VHKLFLTGLVAGLAFLAGCGSLPPRDAGHTGTTATPLADGRVTCQIVFDAGSSGTRLFVYARQGSAWVEHPGPKTGALADPVRQIRGKTHADVETVTRDVVAQLDRMAQPGPAGRGGQPERPAFDWSAQCQVTDAMVLATAGMRLAEYEDPAQSRRLWAGLQARLQARLGPGVRVAARTLTGFEEGLYAWLAVREGRADNRFGIAEMGGASSQVAFPCPGCDPDDDAVRTVQVKGQPVQFYSYSFLGLGQDEAPRALGQPASCAHGVGTQQSGWQPADCARRIDLMAFTGLKDPYNFGPAHTSGAAASRGTARAIPTARADVAGWVLTGAFNYMREDAIGQCCLQAGACYEAPSSCFRAVYLDTYLASLGIPASSPKADVSWTHGAALCAEAQCLQAAAPPRCRWSATGCL
jgi:hypothetical protein